MSEKGANIDLLFRNGLKDFEVLPPPGVWEGVHSAVKVKSRSFVILRIAAVVTVLLTVSFFTYKWSRQISTIPSESEMSFNSPGPAAVISVPYESPVIIPVGKRSDIWEAPVLMDEPSDDPAVPLVSEEKIIPAQIANISEDNNLTLSDNAVRKELQLTPFNSSKEIPGNIKYPVMQLFPDNTPEKAVERWSVAAMASPTYYSRINSGNDALSSQLVSSEQPLFSYSGGVSFSYKISKRFSIQSGLYYSSLGQKA